MLMIHILIPNILLIMQPFVGGKWLFSHSLATEKVVLVNGLLLIYKASVNDD